MSLQEIVPLFNEAETLRLTAGQTIFCAGDSGVCMYFIQEGQVQIVLADNQVLNYLTAGQIFGEMALVDNLVRSATATAVTDVTLVAINKERFLALTQQQPTFATDVMAIMSARLRHFMEEEVKRQRVEEEMAIGRQIQLSLLPQESPSIIGWEFASAYRAARQVGGDLYDFIPDPTWPDLIHLVIADVTGKGVPAALFMAMCRSIIRAAALNGRSPADLLQRANHLLMSERRAWPFLSAFFATLNTQTGQLTYAIGGHDRPYWLQAASGQLQQLASRGMLLGVFPNVHFEEATITLAHGDALILYTDGITEARHEQDMFGETRLETAIHAAAHAPATQLAQTILDAVDHFSANTPQSDDITLVVVKRR
jgi:serine phosphatase RsbU (regulator of sigma subunit)